MDNEVLANIVGGFISFNLDVWDQSGKHFLKKVQSKVLDVCIDPLGRHETKYSVIINNEAFGIPKSEIIEWSPSNGTQFSLFKLSTTTKHLINEKPNGSSDC